MSDSTTAMKPVTERHDFTKAEDLLDFLSPRRDIWRPMPESWIFRGQSKDWPLKAKAHRDGTPFAEFQYPLASTEPKHRRWFVDDKHVRYLLLNFSAELDRAGLPIPAPAPDLYDLEKKEKLLGEPDRQALPTLALAQHFGLPTPWLDWSYHPRMAAYFACADLVWSKEAEEPGQVVVWCMRTDFVSFSVNDGAPYEVDGVYMTLESAPRAGNSRLHAQDGLFSWLHGTAARDRTADGHIEALYAQHIADPAMAFTIAHGPFPMAPPLMYRLALDRSQAPQLLRLLAEEGVTASTVFPGYEGVVTTMRERGWLIKKLGTLLKH